jgi:hypothetical protein
MARTAKGSGAEAGWGEEEPPGPSDAASGPVEPAEVAEYIGSIAGELAGLARGAKLDFLAHLLDMARAAAAEAGGVSRRPDPDR